MEDARRGLDAGASNGRTVIRCLLHRVTGPVSGNDADRAALVYLDHCDAENVAATQLLYHKNTHKCSFCTNFLLGDQNLRSPRLLEQECAHRVVDSDTTEGSMQITTTRVS